MVGLSLNTTRQKTKNLLANPAANLFLLDLAVPYRYLEVRGDAEISADDDHSYADRLGAKYDANPRDRDQPRPVAGQGNHPPRARQRRRHEGLTGAAGT